MIEKPCKTGLCLILAKLLGVFLAHSRLKLTVFSRKLESNDFRKIRLKRGSVDEFTSNFGEMKLID